MNEYNLTRVWTMLFIFISAAMTVNATGSWSAGLAVLFGLWAIAGIFETT